VDQLVGRLKDESCDLIVLFKYLYTDSGEKRSSVLVIAERPDFEN